MFKRFRPIALRKTAVTKRRPDKNQTNQTNKKGRKKGVGGMRKVVMKRFVKGAVITVMTPVCISSRGRKIAL